MTSSHLVEDRDRADRMLLQIFNELSGPVVPLIILTADLDVTIHRCNCDSVSIDEVRDEGLTIFAEDEVVDSLGLLQDLSNILRLVIDPFELRSVDFKAVLNVLQKPVWRSPIFCPALVRASLLIPELEEWNDSLLSNAVEVAPRSRERELTEGELLAHGEELPSSREGN